LEQFGRIGVALLVHGRHPGQVQQPGIGGESVQQGGQHPAGSVGIAGLQMLAGQPQSGGNRWILAHGGHPIGRK
jgi:hypothetical protein